MIFQGTVYCILMFDLKYQIHCLKSTGNIYETTNRHVIDMKRLQKAAAFPADSCAASYVTQVADTFCFSSISPQYLPFTRH